MNRKMYKKDKFSNNYLQVGKQDKAWGLYILNAGYSLFGNKQEDPERYEGIRKNPPSRCFDCFNISCIVSGSMIFFPDPNSQKSIILPANHIIITVPGGVHRYHVNPKTGCEQYWIKFDGTYAHELKKNTILPLKTSVIDISDQLSIASQFMKIHHESELEQNLDTQRKQLPLLISILSALNYSKHNSVNPVIEKAIVFMQANITEHCDLSNFTKKHGMCPHSFRRIFKNATGLPPLQYFLELKLDKAKELLESKLYSVKEVANKLAFYDQYYFSRLFKKKTGIPPGQWTKYHKQS